MQNLINPQQNRLFDAYERVFDESARNDLDRSWPGVFRHVILQLLPAEALARHFDPALGRPTKELYSMAGLIFLKEALNWTDKEAVAAYRYHLDVHYALNLEPVAQAMGLRTLERYLQIFTEDELAARVMEEVTRNLAELMELTIERQRLDSTHVFSDMAWLGRMRLMATVIKRFLAQVRRHDEPAYESLEASLRDRYGKQEKKVFAYQEMDEKARKILRQQVAEDMYRLINLFSDNRRHHHRSTYKDLERVFTEQCRVQEGKVEVLKKPGGDILVNPSDPDATYDGHKGPGYQVQIAETCHPDNEVQLITCALAQTAVESDSDALVPVLKQLEKNNMKPEEMTADTAYGSDQNVQKAAQAGVELIAPAAGQEGEEGTNRYFSKFEFKIDYKRMKVLRCPAGHKPLSSRYDRDYQGRDRIYTKLDISLCCQCKRRFRCPTMRSESGSYIYHEGSVIRLAQRRRDETTEAFKEKYRMRSGIEATNSGLKRKTGLGRLRVRGRPAVFRAIYLKVVGWNMLRAAACAKIQKIVRERALKAVFCLIYRLISPLRTKIKVAVGVISNRRLIFCIKPNLSRFHYTA